MLIKATRKSRGFSLQMFKFIADSGDTLNIVWKIRFKAQFLTQLTYMSLGLAMSNASISNSLIVYSVLISFSSSWTAAMTVSNVGTSPYNISCIEL